MSPALRNVTTVKAWLFLVIMSEREKQKNDFCFQVNELKRSYNEGAAKQKTNFCFRENELKRSYNEGAAK